MSKIKEFKDKLSEIFETDKADLDFGIYRIMNQKRDEINKFMDGLERDVKEQLKSVSGASLDGKKAELEKLAQTLADAGVVAEQSSKYQALKQEVAESIDISAIESDIFSHLTNFFGRYYSEGDFISQRRYKNGVYALPYEGEEVKLHWANHDQYYVKTSENFNNYLVKLTDDKKLHFKIVQADTEQNNNKEAEGKERRFILLENDFLEITDEELIVKFVYTSSKEKQDKLNKDAAEHIKRALDLVEDEDWIPLIFASAATDKKPNRTVFDRELTNYTAKNSFDYFIHKDLAGFLKRELDFYIKNEVMFIDDLDETVIKKSLAKVKAIKNIGATIIQMAASIEDFQKKLWLKKKFVVETNYCATLDKVPVELYGEILTNSEQLSEWEDYYGFGLATEDTESTERGIERLKANDKLVIDTKYFSADFKERLIASIDNLDEELNGLLIHSENFQALNLLQEKYREKVKCVYIDPPYNTEKKDFIYKDGYKSSSWLAFMNDRVAQHVQLMTNKSIFFSNIDENELFNYHNLLCLIHNPNNFIADWVWQNKTGGGNDSKFVAVEHEYIKCFVKDKISTDPFFQPYTADYLKRYKDSDDIGKFYWDTFKRKSGKQYYAITCPDGTILEHDDLGNPISWLRSEKRFLSDLIIGDTKFEKKTDGWSIFFKQRLPDGKKPRSIIYEMGTTSDGNDELLTLFGKLPFSNPKPSSLVKEFLSYPSDSSLILDYFAGSGTTGHAVIDLNREDNGNRKYILVEMGEYFDTVTKPRIKKVIFSKDWKDGKPVSATKNTKETKKAGEQELLLSVPSVSSVAKTTSTDISQIFKYIKLEQYEDTLNNLELKKPDSDLFEQNPQLETDYQLNYALDFETKSSQSLLNIDNFANPFAYKMKITEKEEIRLKNIDLVETFNYLIGLEITRSEKIRYFSFEDKKLKELSPSVPSVSSVANYKIKELTGKTRNGEKVLIIWRNRTNNLALDNEVIEEFFKKQRYNILDMEFDKIYINGDNTLQNLKKDEESWKVELIEEKFKMMMME